VKVFVGAELASARLSPNSSLRIACISAKEPRRA
jgi:hypothetical protein